MSYPKESQTVSQLIKSSFCHYGQTLRASLIFVFIAAVLQDLYLFVSKTHCGTLGYIIFSIAVAVCSLFLWSAALLASDKRIKGESLSTGCAAVITLKKFINVISIAGLYVILFLASSFWMHFLVNVGVAHKVSPGMQGLINLLLIGLPLLILFLGMLFAIPKLMTSDISLLGAIKQSFAAVWRHRFKLALATYFGIMVLVYLIMPATRHGQWLIAHHFKLPVDIIVLVILSPLVINFMLFAMNNPAPVRRSKLANASNDEAI